MCCKIPRSNHSPTSQFYQSQFQFDAFWAVIYRGWAAASAHCSRPGIVIYAVLSFLIIHKANLMFLYIYTLRCSPSYCLSSEPVGWLSCNQPTRRQYAFVNWTRCAASLWQHPQNVLVCHAARLLWDALNAIHISLSSIAVCLFFGAHTLRMDLLQLK